jgi:predicted ATPase with chaperone activity
MVPSGSGPAPAAPASLEDAGVDGTLLADLVLKAAYAIPQFTTDWAARQVCLPLLLVHHLLEQLKTNHLVEVLGQAGPFNYRCAVSQRGREHAARLLEISGYVGPAPVRLETYAAMLEWQMGRRPAVTPEDVSAALSELVLTEHALLVAGLAASSGRSLLIYGPPGNGKTSLGRLLHHALGGDLWVPHSIAVGGSIIRVFDPQCHQPIPAVPEDGRLTDQRWVRVRRPFLVGGGELTLDSFELTYSPTLRYYQAPLHVKANGGTLLIDDFGRQRLEPQQLLNRWIVPLEHQTDYLTLHTGQKIQVPFRQLLIFATNFDPEGLMDPAFLRRMGYRLELGRPSPEQYAQVLHRYADGAGIAVPPGTLPRLLDRYQAEGRELQSSHPRDLIERARDICGFRGQPPELTDAILDLAWASYFGSR